MSHNTDKLLRATKEVFGVVFSHPAVIEMSPDCPGDAPGVVIDHALEITPWTVEISSIVGPREVPPDEELSFEGKPICEDCFDVVD